MTENEATREMTFEEEYEILQKEKEELFAMEICDSEPPFANCVVRRALRCIRKLLEEIQAYRAIGTVEECRTAYAKGYNQGTIDRAEEVTKAREHGYAKAIEEFANELKKHKFHSKERYENCVPVCHIDWIASRMKGGVKC